MGTAPYRTRPTEEETFSTLSTGLTMGTHRGPTTREGPRAFQYPIHGSDHGNSILLELAGSLGRAFSTLSTGLTMGTYAYARAPPS